MPVLIVLFGAQGMATEVLMHVAVASSLAVIIVTSASSVRSHARLGGVHWAIFRQMVASIVAGALLGAWLASQLSSELLRTIFGVFLLAVATLMLFQRAARPAERLPSRSTMSLAGLGIGGFSALVGIGGGTLSVPLLSRAGLPMPQAVGTAAACGMPIAVAGTLGFIVAGWGRPELPAFSTGYVYWPAVAGIAASSHLMAPWGARLAHRLPPLLLRRTFAAVLCVVALRLLFA